MHEDETEEGSNVMQEANLENVDLYSFSAEEHMEKLAG